MPKITIKQAYQQALRRYQKGLLAEAAEITLKILAHDPQHRDSLKLMGLIACFSGRADLAVPYFEQACLLSPNSHELLSNLGEAHRRVGNLVSALSAFHRAIALKPDHAETHNNLGVALRDSGRKEEALNAFRQAVALDASHLAAHNNLGAGLLEMGDLDEAVCTFRNLIALAPGDAGAHINHGAALARQKKLDEAIIAYRQAITLAPDLPLAHNNLGNVLQECDRLDEAVPAFKRALALDPDSADFNNNFGNALKDCGRITEAIAAYRKALAISPGYGTAYSNLLLCLHYSSDQDAGTIFNEHLRWGREQAARWRPKVVEHPNDPDSGRRLRIGYVSPDFRNHSVARFLLPLFENHDKQQVEVFAYAQGRTTDAMTERLLHRADHRRNLTALTDDQAADMIRKDRIDILVDLAQHTHGNRLAVFARKPAPVQVAWLGYPNTTGLDVMDYRLTDEYADPTGQTEVYHSEKLVRIDPCAWCFHPDDETPVVSDSASAVAPATFCCFNNFAKVTDSMLRIWAEILRAVPGSRLLVKSRALSSPSVRDHVVQIMGEQGIESTRLILLGHEPLVADHLALYGQADIALDTYPYHGTTTTCEALWMGVPVITLAGQTHVSRVGVSLLSNVGLQDLIANTTDEYIRIAVALACDHSRLADLRNTLRHGMKASPLMDGTSFAQEMEAAYRAMWTTWCRKPAD